MIDSTAHRMAEVTAMCSSHGTRLDSCRMTMCPVFVAAAVAGGTLRRSLPAVTRNCSMVCCRLRAAAIHSRARSASISMCSPV